MAIPFTEEHKAFYNKYEPTILINKVDEELYNNYIEHHKKNSYFNCKYNLNRPGQLFLYEEVLSDRIDTLHYPKIGIYLHDKLCDQTIEIEWASYRRNWEYRRSFQYTSVDSDGISRNFKTYFFDIDTRINHLIIWSDDLLIYGVWDKLPDWKELKKHYEKTWWYHRTTQEQRDISIDRILNYE